MKSLSPTLKKLIKVLENGEFHSGESLGEKLNISRNAVWKHINQLTKHGVAINSVKSKGYCLQQPIILLDKNLIKKQLNCSEKLNPDNIEVLGSISSTNDYLKTLSGQNQDKINICFAEHQSAGRGRFGRSWCSPFGANIYFSCRWCIAKDVSQLQGLSLVVALAVIQTLKKFKLNHDLAIKWPNDIFWQEKKIGGILIEISAESHGLTQIVIGIGLNINMPIAKTAAEIDCPWIALDQILGCYQDRNIIAAQLINYLMENLQIFHDTGFATFIRDWHQYDYLLGKKIQLQVSDNKVIGTAAGINEYGHLLVEDQSGSTTAYSAGEASLHSTIKSKNQ